MFNKYMHLAGTVDIAWPRTLTGELDLELGTLVVHSNLDVYGTATFHGTVIGTGAVAAPNGDFGAIHVTNSTGTSVLVDSGDDSVSIGTGAVHILGGISVNKSCYLGNVLRVLGTTASTSKTTGCATFAGGIGVNNLVHCAGVYVGNGNWGSNGNDIFLSANTAGIVLRPTTGSNAGEVQNTTTAFFVRNTIGTNILNLNKTTETLTIPATTSAVTTASTSSTGALLLAGGITSTNSTNATSVVTGGALTLVGGAAVGKDLWVGQNLNVIGVVNGSSTTESVSATTGGAILAGGLGIGKSCFVGNELRVLSTTASTSKTTGCATFAGGIGVNGRVDCGSVYVGNGSWGSNGNDIFLSANTSGIVLRPTTGSNVGELQNTTTAFFVRDTTGVNILNLNKTTSVLTIPATISTVTTASTSSAAALFLAGGITSTNTTNATSVTSGGSLTLAGGGAVGQDFYIGQNLNVTGTTTTTNATVTGVLQAGTQSTFTPSFITGATVTYTAQSGTYYYIGKLVYVSIYIETTSEIETTPGQPLQVTGFPFASIDTNKVVAPVLLHQYELPPSADTIKGSFSGTTLSFEAIRSNLTVDVIEAPTTSATRTIEASFVYLKNY